MKPPRELLLFIALLLLLLIPPAALGQEFSAPFDSLTGTIDTDAGSQVATIDGEMNLLIEPQDTFGVSPVLLQGFVLGTSSVPTLSDETGGMSFLVEEGSIVGTWNRNTGDLLIPVQIEAGYWLLDQSSPPTRDGDLFVYSRESWSGEISGSAQITDVDSTILSFNGTVNLTVNLPPLTGNVLSMAFAVTEELQKKEGPPECPPGDKCKKKKLCLQPVFVADADGSNPTGSSLASLKQPANDLWAKCCVELEWKTAITVKKPGYKNIESCDDPAHPNQSLGDIELGNLWGEVDPKGENKCIEIFFVEKIIQKDGDEHGWGDGAAGPPGQKSGKVVIADAVVDDCDGTAGNPQNTLLLAHELGHILDQNHPAPGCEHIMTPTGTDDGKCPNPNENKVLITTCKALKNPLLVIKKPEEECCLNTAATTAVTGIQGLAATAFDDRIEIRWHVVSRLDYLGFDVYRSNNGGPFSRVTHSSVLNDADYYPSTLSWIDTDVVPEAVYSYRIEVIHPDGSRELWNETVATRLPGQRPESFAFKILNQNPIRISMGLEVMVDIPNPGAHVTMSLYNISGQRVHRLLDGVVSPGTRVHSLDLSVMSKLSSGVYFIHMEAGEFSAVKQIVLLK